MQYSCHLPTPFIARHSRELVPEWSSPVGTVLIIFQRAACDLNQRSPLTEQQKNRLRLTFIDLGLAIATQLRQLGHFAELFDPQTGHPLLSTPGTLELDDVAVIRACLGYPTLQIDGCSLVLHPAWGSAVYPSVILSSAPPDTVLAVMHSVAGRGGSIESSALCLTRSEYHHSFMD